MKSLLATLALSTAIVMPGALMAKPVTFSTTMKNYRGLEAYLAIYITNANDRYIGTLWISGRKTKYYSHFTNWFRATGGVVANMSAITGASIGDGGSSEITLDLSDALFDAGYKLHVDVSVEDRRDAPSEIVIPLTSDNSGVGFTGRRYIRNFSFQF